MGGADISILASFVVGALLYYVLARQQVHGEVRLMDVVPQRSVSAAEPLRASAVVEPPSVD
jgi:hypothetical protein